MRAPEDASTGPLLRPAVMTARGHRESNQDRVFALRTQVGREPAVLIGVADGIGGLNGGEAAAEMAVAAGMAFAHRLQASAAPTAGDLRDALRGMFEDAGRRIRQGAREGGIAGATGCTLTSCLVWGRRYLVAHAGDTRCYYVGSDGACCLTEDHTEAQQLVRLGRLAPGLAASSPLCHRLTNAVGLLAEVRVELLPAEGEPALADDGAVLVVCSDGLHGLVGEADLLDAFDASSAGPEEACRRLVALALERGSLDNVSAAAVEVGNRPCRRRRAP